MVRNSHKSGIEGEGHYLCKLGVTGSTPVVSSSRDNDLQQKDHNRSTHVCHGFVTGDSGWETLAAVDFDKWAAATYAANFPGVDVRCAKVSDEIDTLPYADVITGGFPCQPHSVAGKRLASADERDGGDDFVAAIAKGKPRMFLGENVAGLMTSEGGRYAAKLIAKFEAAGYRVEWRILDSVNFGVPQFRNRVWFWGIREDVYAEGVRWAWPKPTHAWPPPVAGLFGGDADLLPGVTVGQALGIWYPGCGWEQVDASPKLLTNVSCAETAGSESPYFPPSQPCRTVLNSGIFVVPPPDESPSDRGARLRQRRKEREAIKAGGVPVRVMGGGSHPDLRKGIDSSRDITAEPCTTLNKEANHGDNSPVVHCYDHGLANPSEPSPTLKAGGNIDASGKQGGGCPPAIPYRWSDAMLTKHPPASPASPASTVQAKYAKGGAEGLLEVSVPDHLSEDGRTFESRHPPATPATPAPTVRARSPRDGGRCIENVVKDGLMVRRLSPAECGRLQSLPDDFAWPAKITKTAMYRVIGNGWSCAMGYVFAQAFRAADPKSRTVVDLFCGGGLGAVGWHGRRWVYGGGK